ncbi:MAG: hypothetical protein K9K38_17200 [Rhodoferax sp.]|nr:hypothetical protein [Rhodoferax sp.]MCF8211116.1 hypothetical protein [Rhodoferax sp.]
MTTIQKYEYAALFKIASLMGLEPNDVDKELQDVLLDHFHQAHSRCMEDGLILSGYVELLQLGVKSITQVDAIEVIATSPELKFMLQDLQRAVKRLLPKGARKHYKAG